MIIRSFAASVPTKPLNDAQMRGAFFFTLLCGFRHASAVLGRWAVILSIVLNI